MLKSCAGVLIALPLFVLGVEVAESFARGVGAAVLSASYVEDLPAAVAACLGLTIMCMCNNCKDVDKLPDG